MAMAISTVCFTSGFFLAALGVYFHQIFLLYFGYGIIGGIGLGMGYISPVSTLMKWFPDKPGMATGLAIMGFGGGAIIGSPLAFSLMNHFKSATGNGVLETFLVMGILYLVLMLFGVFNIRMPHPSLLEKAGLSQNNEANKNKDSKNPVRNVSVEEAVRTKQFWLLWLVLCTNVTAGIAILSQASPMIQEMFPDHVTAAGAAGFVGLLSLFNLGGRFLWSSFSDKLGRKLTYTIYFGLGIILYSLIPQIGKGHYLGLFIGTACLIISMYGGGFATIPAYLKDIFGLYNVGAIHGRLLTAWSTAGILGPALITYLREAQIKRGVSAADSYTLTLQIMLVVLLVGFIANRKVMNLASVESKG
jgi:MFS family permease